MADDSDQGGGPFVGHGTADFPNCASRVRRVQMGSRLMSNLVYLSLGSNLGDRETHLQDAIARISIAGRVVSLSSFYDTEPVGYTDQAWFLNCAVGLESLE